MRKRQPRRAVAAVAIAVLATFQGAATARAQTPPAPATPSEAPGWFVAGPIAVKPTVSVILAGIDTNVFNEEEAPKSDVTSSLSPQVQGVFAVRSLRVSGSTSADFQYYRTYASERSINRSHDVRAALALHRIAPSIGYSYLDSRERTSPEIDVRARRHVETLDAGLDFAVSSRTLIEVAAQRSTTRFDEEATFENTSLSRMLNRTTTTANVSARYELTHLTTLVLLVDRQADEFEFASERDSTSGRLTPGIELGRFALVSGRAFVGYRRFDIRDPAAPAYQGLVASIDLSSTWRGSVRLSVRAGRDLGYSYSANEPYFVLQGLDTSITWRISPRWDLMAGGGRQLLTYQTLRRTTQAPDEPATPSQTLHTARASLGFRLSRAIRFSVNGDYSRRPDGLRREFEGLRAFSAITLGY